LRHCLLYQPTDQAFQNAGLDAAAIGELSQDELRQILEFHVVSDDIVLQKDLKKRMSFGTLLGNDQRIEVDPRGSSWWWWGNKGVELNGGVNIEKFDILANNGAIHIIDSVLLPPQAQDKPTIAELAAATDDLSTLVSAIELAEFVELLDNTSTQFTVFAPTNQAFELLTREIGAEAVDALLADKEAQVVVLSTSNAQWKCERSCHRHQRLEWSYSQDRRCFDSSGCSLRRRRRRRRRLSFLLYVRMAANQGNL
jgi:uncharacterized surface protein with fasciclin (FAS1) repeats